MKTVDSGNIRKITEFKEFIKILEGEQIEHWLEIAKVLDVDKDTITEWKKTKEAKEAIAKGIKKALLEMQKSGRNDWRMWREKTKMLGVNDVEKQDITSGGQSIIIKPVMYGDNLPKSLPTEELSD